MNVGARNKGTYIQNPCYKLLVRKFSASYYSVVLDKAHMVFSPCQTICPYTHAVFIGFINRIDIILGKG